ncbi:OsmC family peroxiredoxin [Miniimonas arenae]|uniref:OsmC family peroxiredoxin n=1 Tax=Miniimonas arenae TaxID=676201 RepID=A0A5C5BC05_9MICO|nr:MULTISPECIES: OsmC family protein [Miniimonas]TNU75107.1 OsmC family peroxiredoxin [Miniimonas arenae]
MTTHTYRTDLTWTGATGVGYAAYPREHRVEAPPATASLDLSADPHFRGAAERLNPEQLVVAAASSCQLLSFLAVAARAGVDVVGYADHAVGTMDLRDAPIRIGAIALDVTVTVAPGTHHALVHRLAEEAHGQCYIANSLRSDVTLALTVVDA